MKNAWICLIGTGIVLALLTSPSLAAENQPPDDLAALKAMEVEEEFVAELLALNKKHLDAFKTIADAIGTFPPPSPDQRAALEKEGTAHINTLRSALSLAIERFGDNARVLNYYGEFLYDFEGNQQEAIRRWKRAKEHDPNYALPYNNLGIHYQHIGAYQKGLQELEQALYLDKNNPDILFNVAQMYLIHPQVVQEAKGWRQKGTVFKKAMKYSKKAAQLSDNDYSLLQDYAVNFMAGERFEVKVNWKEAAQAWQAARAHAPSKNDVFYCWLNEGRIWKKGNKTDEARACFEEALNILPESEVAARLLKSLDDAS